MREERGYTYWWFAAMKRLLQRLAKLRGKSSKANGDASAERRERELRVMRE